MTNDIAKQAKDLYKYIESEGLLRGDANPLLEKLTRLVLELINEVDKWRHIAIDERCKAIMLIEKLKDVANANNPDWQTRGLSMRYEEYMQQATDELGIDIVNK